MLELFEQYKSKGDFAKALILGRNLFNRHPESKEIFDAYFDFLCTLAENLPAMPDRQRFSEQANIALSFFTENADLSEELLNDISNYQQRMDNIFISLQEQQDAAAQAERKQIEQQNQELLLKIHDLKSQISRASDQSTLDKILPQLAKLDAELNKDIFTVEQEAYYNTETKAFTELISETMRRLEYDKNVAYNKQAVDAYSKALAEFRSDESKYSKISQLRALASRTLFAYDASRLFNETLIYYNHIYSYIFGKLDEEGKFALTKCSIECERKKG